MPRPAAFLFDMDGVVCDNMRAHEEAWRRFFRGFGLEIDAREFRENTMGMPTREVLRHYFRREVPAEEASRLAESKERLYRELYGPDLSPAPGLVEFLRAARARGLRLGLGTGSKADNVAFVLDGLGLREAFDAVVDADAVARGKPDPETWLTLAARLGVAAADCVVFEDSLLGEEAARRAGMAVVAVTTSHEASEFRRARLSARDFLALTPERVLECGRAEA